MVRRFSALLLVTSAVLAAAPATADAANDLYRRENTWQETMRAARAAYQRWQTEQTGGAAVEFGPLYVTEPLRSSAFSKVLFPEKAVQIDAEMPDGRRAWNVRFDLTDGEVHSLPSEAPSATYLTRVITASAPAALNVGLGSDDGLEVWLNGEKILSREILRTAAPNQDVLELPLQAGENRLMLKIYNAAGGCGFYFSLLNDPAAGLWRRIQEDFPVETGWMLQDNPGGSLLAWFTLPDNVDMQKRMIARVLDPAGDAAEPLRSRRSALDAAAAEDTRWLDLYVDACRFRQAVAKLARVDLAALRRAIDDLARSFPDQYTRADEFLARVAAAEQQLPAIQRAVAEAAPDALVDGVLAIQYEALLANPLLDFDRLLLVKRSESAMGLPQNWQGNCAIPTRGYDNEIAVMSPVRPDAPLSTFYRPQDGAFVGDVDLSPEADRMLFSMPGSHGRWQIWEIRADGTGLRQATPGEEPDVDNYDACYLPDGRITFASTCCFQGIPCVGGGNTVANLCRMDAGGSNMRQLCFDQDHNWCPTVLNNGRVMYSRWEYSDTPHYFSRLLFSMNPDGTNQCEYYGSNSYWPNSIFYARPLPGHPSAVVAIISGHHGVARMGELVVFDPAKSRFEGDGVVQRIPGHGKKVEPVIMDTLVDAVWPKFLHPYPLSDKYFLVSCKPNPEEPWGIYLVDVFDNMLLLREEPGYALLEPLPFRESPKAPVIPDKVRLDNPEATVYLSDVYRGEGLRGVPRGTVKALRVYEFHYTYPQMGGHINIGVEGPWDVHRILGTVPVHEDGSAYFKIPANTPVAVQPLDAKGRAVQVMRSWFVGMPGEAVSCVGCHEKQNMTPTLAPALAARRAPVAIEPWKGPARGFSFKREVQPVLDRLCVGCHDGRDEADGHAPPDFTRKDKNGWGNFTPSYLALHPYVRRPGPESDYHLQKPAEFSATTSELIQMLEKGHYGVALDEDAWDRLYTWIDLNVPDHGSWREHRDIPSGFDARRKEMRAKYACSTEDPELEPASYSEPVPFVQPQSPPEVVQAAVLCDGWPMSTANAAAKQQAAGPARRTLDLGNGVTLDLALIPAGEFVMGGNDGDLDERPAAAVIIDEPFWMGVVEVTNAQYQQFDPAHDNGFIDQQNKDHTTPGYSVQDPSMPAIRVSWNEAMAFCRWLSERIGEPCTLPAEAQWEWACRAGSADPFWYGTLDTDFSACANLADLSIRRLAVAGINPQPIENPSPYEDFLPKDPRFDDGERIMTTVGKYQPNGWGLYDMHGNAAEWTLSAYRAYPYADNDGRNDPAAEGRRVVRGGSWFDRPKRARAGFRLAYEPWQPVYNVGFRVVLPLAGAGRLVAGR